MNLGRRGHQCSWPWTREKAEKATNKTKSEKVEGETNIYIERRKRNDAIMNGSTR